MNYSRAIFLISDKVRAVAATYEPPDLSRAQTADNQPRTIFKTFDHLKIGDLIVVPTDTRHKMTVCKVVEVDVDVDLESTTELKWVISRIHLGKYEDTLHQEAQAIEKIKSAEKRRKRAELRDALLADAGDDIKKLPIYSDDTDKDSDVS